jgi:hypothetical protein
MFATTEPKAILKSNGVAEEDLDFSQIFAGGVHRRPGGRDGSWILRRA